ncbi:MAG: serine/threonine-protein kinase [Planctomycetota bacterium]
MSESSLSPLELAQRAYDEFHERTMRGETLATDQFCQEQPAACRELLRQFLSVHLAVSQQSASWFQKLEQQLDPPSHPWPECGTEWQGFALDQPLGDGGLARVYLAREVHAGGRPVVVKITQFETGEGHLQSPLMHAHIVPVLTVRHDETTGLTGIVMPYLGRATLQDVLTELGRRRQAATPASSSAAAATHGGNQSLPGILNWNVASSEIFTTVAQQALSQSTKSRQADSSLPTPPLGTPSLLLQVADPGTTATAFLPAVARLGVQLAEALAHTHAHQILHRDIKPSNILIASDGRPLLMDFNLSARVDGAELVLGGTIPYMPCELLQSIIRCSATTAAQPDRSQPAARISTLRAFETTHPDDSATMLSASPISVADPRSDLFSLGVVLYELLCGELPFGEPRRNLSVGEQAAAMELSQHQTQLIDRLRSSQLPTPWADILQRCLAPNPEARFVNADELANALRPLIDPLATAVALPERTASPRLGTSLSSVASQTANSLKSGLRYLAVVATIVIALWPASLLPRAGKAGHQPTIFLPSATSNLLLPTRSTYLEISRSRPNIERRLYQDLLVLAERLRIAVESPRAARESVEQCREQLEFFGAQSLLFQADIQGLIGFCHAYQGRHQQALECWEKSLAEQETAFIVDLDRAAVDYAVSLRQRGRYEEAIYWSSLALNEDSQDGACLAAAAESTALSQFRLLEKFLAESTLRENQTARFQETSRSLRLALHYNRRSSILVSLVTRLDEIQDEHLARAEAELSPPAT